jgi:hypothetical protein
LWDLLQSRLDYAADLLEGPRCDWCEHPVSECGGCQGICETGGSGYGCGRPVRSCACRPDTR